MGTPLPEISPDCPTSNFCWTSGAFDNPPHSPLFMKIKFEGIRLGSSSGPATPPPLNGIFILEQESATVWSLIVLPFKISVELTNLHSIVFITFLPNPLFKMFGQITTPCVLSYVSTISCSVPNAHCGGTAEILEIS